MAKSTERRTYAISDCVRSLRDKIKSEASRRGARNPRRGLL